MPASTSSRFSSSSSSSLSFLLLLLLAFVTASSHAFFASSTSARVHQQQQSLLTRLATTRGGVAGKVKEVTSLEETEAALAEAGDKLVVLDFTATWCGPCRLIAPVFEALSEEIDDAVFLKVDVDVNEGTAKKFEVFQMPTFVFYKGGEVQGRLVGANPDKLREAVNKFLL